MSRDTIKRGDNIVRIAVHETINYPILWLKEISWRRGALEEGKTNLKLTYRDVRELIMQGAPKEKESDRCLADIVRYKLNSNDRVPGLCVEILTSRKSARGYPLTHRLLIVLIAKIVSAIDIFFFFFFFFFSVSSSIVVNQISFLVEMRSRSSIFGINTILLFRDPSRSNRCQDSWISRSNTRFNDGAR